MDLSAIARVLGGYKLRSDGTATFIVVSQKSNVRLKLEVNPATGWLRLHADQAQRVAGGHISVIEFPRVDGAIAQLDTVHFAFGNITLVVRATGTFQVRVA